jgi:hypothetical protein
MERPCEHKHVETLARQAGVEYVRCRDCGQVCEAEDLEPVFVNEDD